MCIFCDIVEGKIPSYTIYEDDYVKAFLDISQVTKGHTLIVTKKHYENFLTCDSEDLKHTFEIANHLGKHLLSKLDAKGMNLLSNVSEMAGQTVNHFHLHLIPRYDENDSCIIRFEKSERQNLDAVMAQIND